MAGDLNDVKAILRAALVADAGLTALVARRVQPAHIRLADATKATYPMVVLDVRGGHLEAADCLQDVAFEIWAYSRTSLDEAGRVYQTAKAALQDNRLLLSGVDMVLVAWEQTRPEDGWNEAVDGWYARGRWNCTAVG